MNCIDNGMHSFKKSLNKLFELDKVEDCEIEFHLKDIIMDFHHSLEILCKHLVARKGKYYLYEDTSKIFEKEVNIKIKEKYNKRLDTIKYIDAVNRVLMLYNQDIDKHTYGMFKELNNLRNELTHYEVDIERIEVEYVIASLLPTITNIFENNIKEFNEYMMIKEVKKNVDGLYEKRDLWKLTTVIKMFEKYKDSNIHEVRYSSDDHDNSTLLDRKDMNMLELIGYDSWEYYSIYDFLSKQIDCLLFRNYYNKLLDLIVENEKTKQFLEVKSEILEEVITEILNSKIIYSLQILIESSNSEYKKVLDDLNKRVEVFSKLDRPSQLLIVKDLIKMKEKISSCKSIFKKYEKFLNTEREFKYENIKYKKWMKKQYKEVNFKGSYKKCIVLLDEIMDKCKWEEMHNSAFDFNQEAGMLGCKEECIEEILQQIVEETIFGNISSDIMQSSFIGDWGTIDRVEECEPYIIYIIEEGHMNYYLIFECNLSCSRYFEGDFHDNGSCQVCVGANVSIDSSTKEVAMSSIELL